MESSQLLKSAGMDHVKAWSSSSHLTSVSSISVIVMVTVIDLDCRGLLLVVLATEHYVFLVLFSLLPGRVSSHVV